MRKAIWHICNYKIPIWTQFHINIESTLIQRNYIDSEVIYPLATQR